MRCWCRWGEGKGFRGSGVKEGGERKLLTQSPDAGRGRAANPSSLSLGRLAQLRRAPDAGGWKSVKVVSQLKA